MVIVLMVRVTLHYITLHYTTLHLHYTTITISLYLPPNNKIYWLRASELSLASINTIYDIQHIINSYVFHCVFYVILIILNMEMHPQIKYRKADLGKNNVLFI